MRLLNAAFHELSGLFVEDGALALEIVAVVIVASAIARLFPAGSMAAGGILLFGCLAALAANVAGAARR
ncbi:MAG: hypothetical protein ACHQC9_02500 [Alphaproteobacteria bacterium]